MGNVNFELMEEATVAEVDAANRVTKQPLSADESLQFFEYAHLPPHLQAVSAPIGVLAHRLVQNLPDNPQRAKALELLVTVKDHAVRALLYKSPGQLIEQEEKAHVR